MTLCLLCQNAPSTQPINSDCPRCYMATIDERERRDAEEAAGKLDDAIDAICDLQDTMERLDCRPGDRAAILALAGPLERALKRLAKRLAEDGGEGRHHD